MQNQTHLLHGSGIDHCRHRQLLHSLAVLDIYTCKCLEKRCEECKEQEKGSSNANQVSDILKPVGQHRPLPS